MKKDVMKILEYFFFFHKKKKKALCCLGLWTPQIVVRTVCNDGALFHY